jgi:hypothetical protein
LSFSLKGFEFLKLNVGASLRARAELSAPWFVITTARARTLAPTFNLERLTALIPIAGT